VPRRRQPEGHVGILCVGEDECVAAARIGVQIGELLV
jgi:hypothetical protein